MLVYLRDGSATLRFLLQIKLSNLTQSQYTDTGPTSPGAHPMSPGVWQGSHWSANFEVTDMTRPCKKSRRKQDSNPGSSAPEVDALPNRPLRLLVGMEGLKSKPFISL